MPNANDALRCQACNAPLENSFQAFAFQLNQIQYTRPGETPSQQAHLNAGGPQVVARFCNSGCCKPALGPLLKAQGIAAHYSENRVHGGPICPCGKCGKPVNLTQTHGAWVRAKFGLDENGLPDAHPDWFDVLTVVCSSCLSEGDSIALEQKLPECGELDCAAPLDEIDASGMLSSSRAAFQPTT